MCRSVPCLSAGQVPTLALLTNAKVRNEFSCSACSGRGCSECNSGVRFEASTDELLIAASKADEEERETLLLTLSSYGISDIREAIRKLHTEVLGGSVEVSFAIRGIYHSLMTLWNVIVMSGAIREDGTQTITI